MKLSQLKNFARKFWKDESGQGATEYILLLVVVVGLVLLFKDRIKEQMSGILEKLSGEIGKISP